MFPLGYDILVYDLELQDTVQILMSSLCSVCCGPRGTPRPVTARLGGIRRVVHRWRNPCGHRDTDQQILYEAEIQCRKADCAVMASTGFHPYCGPECAASILDGMADDLETLIGTFLTANPEREGREEIEDAVNSLIRASHLITQDEGR